MKKALVNFAAACSLFAVGSAAYAAKEWVLFNSTVGDIAVYKTLKECNAAAKEYRASHPGHDAGCRERG